MKTDYQKYIEHIKAKKPEDRNNLEANILAEELITQEMVLDIAKENHIKQDNCIEEECLICGKRDCPHGDMLHYHHDGCPSCDRIGKKQ